VLCLFLSQDYCGGNTSTNGTFRVITQNVPCGTTGTTCSKAIKVFVEVKVHLWPGTSTSHLALQPYFCPMTPNQDLEQQTLSVSLQRLEVQDPGWWAMFSAEV
jgi:hypothetical protein